MTDTHLSKILHGTKFIWRGETFPSKNLITGDVYKISDKNYFDCINMSIKNHPMAHFNFDGDNKFGGGKSR